MNASDLNNRLNGNGIVSEEHLQHVRSFLQLVIKTEAKNLWDMTTTEQELCHKIVLFFNTEEKLEGFLNTYKSLLELK